MGFWVTCEVTMMSLCHGCEADSHLKLLPTSSLDIYQCITSWFRPTSSLDIYKVFGHIDIVAMGIGQQPQTGIPASLGSKFGVLGRMWSQHDVFMSWLRLTATSNCLLHPY